MSEYFDVSALGGQTVTLVAYSVNVGDDRVETRLLLDNVRVAEPDSLALFGVALAGLGFARIRKSRTA